MSRWFFVCGLILLVIWVILGFYRNPLPSAADLSSRIFVDPKQTPLRMEPFVVEKGGFVYTFTPKFSYEVSGVVVSMYDSESWFDFTHAKDPANTKDVCVVWGKNATNPLLSSIKFSSGEFTCFYQWSGTDPGFSNQHISNNHMIPATEEVKKLIKNVRIGDQVTFSGYLTDYEVKDAKGNLVGKRTTSITREDTRNGACEVVYATDGSIISRTGFDVNLVRGITFILSMTCFGFGVFVFFLPGSS